MLTSDMAITIAVQFLKEKSSSCGLSFLLRPAATREEDFGWVFFYNEASHERGQTELPVIPGNAPFIVNKLDGTVHQTGTGQPVEWYINNFRRFGSPYPPR